VESDYVWRVDTLCEANIDSKIGDDIRNAEISTTGTVSESVLERRARRLTEKVSGQNATNIQYKVQVINPSQGG
jgi:hypothetical protein